MQDRLAELRRQRALVADHLAWLDREIAGMAPSELPATPLAPSPEARLAATAPAPPLPVIPPGQSRSPTAASLELPESSPANIKQDVRRGCFIYVALAALLVVLGGALLVWGSQIYKAKHPPVPRVEQSESR